MGMFTPFNPGPDDYQPIWPEGPTMVQFIEGLRVGHVSAEYELLQPHLDDWVEGRDDRFLADLGVAARKGLINEDDEGETGYGNDDDYRDDHGPWSWV